MSLNIKKKQHKTKKVIDLCVGDTFRKGDDGGDYIMVSPFGMPDEEGFTLIFSLDFNDMIWLDDNHKVILTDIELISRVV